MAAARGPATRAAASVICPVTASAATSATTAVFPATCRVNAPRSPPAARRSATSASNLAMSNLSARTTKVSTCRRALSSYPPSSSAASLTYCIAPVRRSGRKGDKEVDDTGLRHKLPF
ncbi:hypothetical protein N656DRAFT_624216 [Canariomyces notabilis]|uniref:Uncharacterized protein n=1 Tax=Canariomyces notabilis TaxID=2074819 RepID=A0AAN6TFH9_9PEZI|nr:hypothetical protein N656DRAFT_624216 [Canariomyces arenarius]